MCNNNGGERLIESQVFQKYELNYLEPILCTKKFCSLDAPVLFYSRGLRNLLSIEKLWMSNLILDLQVLELERRNVKDDDLEIM